MKTNKKGISLIVLVITIVVMIIIAAAVILYLDESKVVRNAEKAVTMSNVAAAKEVVAVAKAEWRVNKDKIIEDEKATTLKEYAEYKLEEAGFEIGNNGGEVEVTESGLLKAYFQPIIPAGYVASNVDSEDEVSEGLVIYEGVVPVTDNNVEDAQTTRNQYVWIPVPNMSEFVRKDWSQYVANAENMYGNCSFKSIVSESGYAADYAAMKESVAKYGGFYIARYEAGKGENGAVISMKEKTVWNNLTFVTAKSSADTVNVNGMVSHLVYGEEWDAALNFISKTNSSYPINGEDTGWYSEDYNNGNSTQKTGIDFGDDSTNKVNNIYDMAGNVLEWTMEYDTSISTGITRGGSYLDSETIASAARRHGFSQLSLHPCYGFRVALYIK